MGQRLLEIRKLIVLGALVASLAACGSATSPPPESVAEAPAPTQREQTAAPETGPAAVPSVAAASASEPAPPERSAEAAREATPIVAREAPKSQPRPRRVESVPPPQPVVMSAPAPRAEAEPVPQTPGPGRRATVFPNPEPPVAQAPPVEEVSAERDTPPPPRTAAAPAPERRTELVIPPPPPLPGPAAGSGAPGSAAAATAGQVAGPAPEPEPELPAETVLPEGTVIEVRLAERLTSAINQVGDRFDSILDRDIEDAEGQVLLPKGTPVEGTIVAVAEPGRVKGRASLTFRLSRLELGHDSPDILTNEITIEAEGGKADDAKKVGIGAAVGAAVGAIFGGKRGAAIGGATGAGSSTARVLLTKGKQVVIERERLFSFRLEQDVALPAR